MFFGILYVELHIIFYSSKCTKMFLWLSCAQTSRVEEWLQNYL